MMVHIFHANEINNSCGRCGLVASLSLFILKPTTLLE